MDGLLKSFSDREIATLVNIGEGPETKQATISSDIDQVRRKKGGFNTYLYLYL